MNYIELINRFWDLDEVWQFTCCETRLYFYLVKTANRLGWVDNWIHSIDKLVGNVGVSKNSIKNARNRLSQAGLISFKEGGKGHGDKTRYQILTPKHDPKPYPKHDPKVDPKPTPLYNKTKTKTETNNNTPLPPEGEKPLSKKKNKGGEEFLLVELKKFVHPELLDSYVEYINMRKELKKPFKSLTALKSNYEQLIRFSDGINDIAKEILTRSVANQWQGIFPLNNSNKNGNSSQVKEYTGNRNNTGRINAEDRRAGLENLGHMCAAVLQQPSPESNY